MQEAQQARQRAAGQPKHPRPNLKTPYTAPRTEQERKIVAIWQEMLGVEPVGVEDNFFELGGDSLVGIELVSRLTRELEQPVSAVSLFEGPTVNALIELLNPAEDKEAHLDESRRRGQLRAQRQQQRSRGRNI
jgi:acyl carrier protein